MSAWAVRSTLCAAHSLSQLRSRSILPTSAAVVALSFDSARLPLLLLSQPDSSRCLYYCSLALLNLMLLSRLGCLCCCGRLVQSSRSRRASHNVTRSLARSSSLLSLYLRLSCAGATSNCKGVRCRYFCSVAVVAHILCVCLCLFFALECKFPVWISWRTEGKGNQVDDKRKLQMKKKTNPN